MHKLDEMGFEPMILLKNMIVFKTTALNHSATHLKIFLDSYILGLSKNEFANYMGGGT